MPQVMPMKSGPRLFRQRQLFAVGVITDSPSRNRASVVKNADIQTVIEEVARLTGTTFLFGPARVKGKITVLAAGDATPAQALELLRSALGLHGFVLVPRPEAMWIVPAHEVAGAGTVVRVVQLTYVDAEDVAWTLAWTAPPGLRIVPFPPTNSGVISGPEAAVEQMLDLIRRP